VLLLVKNVYTIIVKKGLTLGGFSDNYECGYWGDETPPMQKNKKARSANGTNDLKIEKTYVIKNDSKYLYLNILLSPLSLLRDEEQEERTNLIQLCNTETELELLHRQNLDIYYDDVFIGSVQKVFEDEGIDNTEIVNEFCFLDAKLKKIEAFWSGEFFCLRQRA
jgi:hypothetical protein